MTEETLIETIESLDDHNSFLLSENQALNKRIKYLQEAFDAAEGVIKMGCGCPYGDEVFYCSRCIEAGNRYDRAKSAKEVEESK
jgi:hypothetical protein